MEAGLPITTHLRALVKVKAEACGRIKAELESFLRL